MKNKLLNTLSRMYDYTYTDKPYKRVKTVSFLVYKGKVISFGINSDKTSPLQNFYRVKTPLKSIENFVDKEHSEINCLKRVDGSITNWDKIELVIISKKIIFRPIFIICINFKKNIINFVKKNKKNRGIF